jgi:hypothetical protein
LISIISYFKNNFDSVKLLKINSSANSESLQLLNINNISRRSYETSKNIMCINLDDTLEVRKTFFDKKKDIF